MSIFGHTKDLDHVASLIQVWLSDIILHNNRIPTVTIVHNYYAHTDKHIVYLYLLTNT